MCLSNYRFLYSYLFHSQYHPTAIVEIAKNPILEKIKKIPDLGLGPGPIPDLVLDPMIKTTEGEY